MNNTVVEVLKWIGIVFAAGFVGYFGRHLAMILIDKMHRKKGDSVPPAHPQETSAETQQPDSAGVAEAAARAKIEKKRAKAEVKRGKREKG
jgi:hypothetical protein